MFLAVVAMSATGCTCTQSEAWLLAKLVSPIEPATPASMATPAVLHQLPAGMAPPPQVPAEPDRLSIMPRLTRKLMVAGAPLDRAALLERMTRVPPVRFCVQPVGRPVTLLTVVTPLMKPGIGSFTTTPVVGSPLLLMTRV